MIKSSVITWKWISPALIMFVALALQSIESECAALKDVLPKDNIRTALNKQRAAARQNGCMTAVPGVVECLCKAK
ncbi:MAG TPA: hypothetical protein PKE03_08425, partial [Bacteroidales bacterium]|nr:hypothetical protein [Bacteroidales bacterium]